MATLTSTGITFSDGSSLASATPTAGGIGSTKWGVHIQTTPSPPNNNITNYSLFSANATIAGSSLASDFANSGNTGNAPFLVNGVFWTLSTRRTMPFPSSAQSGSSATGFQGSFGNNLSSYSTQSGSWRSMSGYSYNYYYDSAYNETRASWYATYWVRYA